MTINELIQVGTEKKEVIVYDFDEQGDIIGEHTEIKEVPIMQNVTREMSSEEVEEYEKSLAEIPPQEPTFEDRIEAQVMFTALMTDTLLEE